MNDDMPSGKRMLELASLATRIQERAADNSSTPEHYRKMLVDDGDYAMRWDMHRSEIPFFVALMGDDYVNQEEHQRYRREMDVSHYGDSMEEMER